MTRIIAQHYYTNQANHILSFVSDDQVYKFRILADIELNECSTLEGRDAGEGARYLVVGQIKAGQRGELSDDFHLITTQSEVAKI